MIIDYEKISNEINIYGREVLKNIQKEYSYSLTNEQKKLINEFLNDDFIIINTPSEEDNKFFKGNIPPAHGGRTKSDNKIHIYPYTKEFINFKSNEEMTNFIKDNIIVHEIFHYFIRPKYEQEELGHFITEGLVQYYTEKYSDKYNLVKPKSNYDENVEFAKVLISSLNKNEIDKKIFTYNLEQLIDESKENKLFQEKLKEFNCNKKLHDKITSLIKTIGNELVENNQNKEEEIINYYSKINNIDEIKSGLSMTIELLFKNNEDKKKKYLTELDRIISNKEVINSNNVLETKEDLIKLKKEILILEKKELEQLEDNIKLSGNKFGYISIAIITTIIISIIMCIYILIR